VKNKLLEDNKLLHAKYIRYKKLVSQLKSSEIKVKYEHQKKISDLQEEHQTKLKAAIKELKETADKEILGHY
jgi:hypothetical protein